MRAILVVVGGVLAAAFGASNALAAPPPAPGPDLVIHVAHAQSIPSGGTGTYTVMVTNLGGATGGAQITVTTTLPFPLLTLTSSTSIEPGWACTNDDLIHVLCTSTTNLPAGASSRIQLNVAGLSLIPADQQLDVTAAVDVAGDTNPANNAATDQGVLLGTGFGAPGAGAQTFSFVATEGQPYSGPIGFCDTVPFVQEVANFSWGDGSVDPSGIVGQGPQVIGTHTFAQAGLYTIQMLCIGEAPIGPSGELVGVEEPVNTLVQVLDAQLSVGPVLPQNPIVEGSGATVTVATFFDQNILSAQPGDFLVDVVYLDSIPTLCSVEPSAFSLPGAFDVRCFRFWAEAGTFQPALVQVLDTRGGGVPLVVTGAGLTSTVVTEAPLSGAGVDGSLISELPATFSGPVATFTDANVAANLADLDATIAWGDGSISPGQVDSLGGGFVVTGNHQFGATGTFTVTTTIGDPGAQPLVVSSDVVVISAPGCTTNCGGPPPSATPELDSLLLLVSGLTGVGGYALTRRRARKP